MRIFGRGEVKTSCSFCGKSHEQVQWLIAGEHVYICDSCVGICSELLARHSGASKFIKSSDGIFNLQQVISVTEIVAPPEQKEITWDTPPPVKELLLQFPGGMATRVPLSERERIEKFLLRGNRTI